MWESLQRRLSGASAATDAAVEQALSRAAALLARSTSTLVLTGAGLSTPSGIPDFRTPHAGLWEALDPMEVASLWAFHRAPERFFAWLRPLGQTLVDAQPNAGHVALAQLEAAGLIQRIVTQNIDNLHQRAGSVNVLELHGHIRTATCLECGTVHAAQPLWDAFLQRQELPHCENCRAVIKPDVILFGEPIPYQTLRTAQEETLRCEVFVVIGSSLKVEPAADLPFLARRRGAQIIVINLMPTPIDSQAEIAIYGDTSVILPRLADLLTGDSR